MVLHSTSLQVEASPELRSVTKQSLALASIERLVRPARREPNSPCNNSQTSYSSEKWNRLIKIFQLFQHQINAKFSEIIINCYFLKHTLTTLLSQLIIKCLLLCSILDLVLFEHDVVRLVMYDNIQTKYSFSNKCGRLVCLRRR